MPVSDLFADPLEIPIRLGLGEGLVDRLGHQNWVRWALEDVVDSVLGCGESELHRRVVDGADDGHSWGPLIQGLKNSEALEIAEIETADDQIGLELRKEGKELSCRRAHQDVPVLGSHALLKLLGYQLSILHHQNELRIHRWGGLRGAETCASIGHG